MLVLLRSRLAAHNRNAALSRAHRGALTLIESLQDKAGPRLSALEEGVMAVAAPSCYQLRA